MAARFHELQASRVRLARCTTRIVAPARLFYISIHRRTPRADNKLEQVGHEPELLDGDGTVAVAVQALDDGPEVLGAGTAYGAERPGELVGTISLFSWCKIR